MKTLTPIVSWIALACLLLITGLPGYCRADGGGGGGGVSAPEAAATPEDPDYTTAVKAIERGNFATAQKLLEGVVARDPKNADAFNWLAYSMRQSGDPTGAIPVYQKALAIDPKHRGAHEYIGEAYLVLDDLPKAKQHLAALDKLCFLPCGQYRDLKKAVEAYERSAGKIKPQTATK